jgi:hypothetical protein
MSRACRSGPVCATFRVLEHLMDIKSKMIEME